MRRYRILSQVHPMVWLVTQNENDDPWIFVAKRDNLPGGRVLDANFYGTYDYPFVYIEPFQVYMDENGEYLFEQVAEWKVAAGRYTLRDLRKEFREFDPFKKQIDEKLGQSRNDTVF